MAEAAQTQIYLTLETAQVGRLEALLSEVNPACVRLVVLAGTNSREAAQTCRALCHTQGVPLVIAGPDDTAVALARAVGADGVHLTGAPKAAPWVRGELGDDCIVGIDPGPSRHDAMIAAEAGADYVSLAPDWDDDGTVPAEIQWWATMIETPMVVENATNPGRITALTGVAEFIVAGPDAAPAMADLLQQAG